MSAEPNRYVLDSFALLAYLEAEPGWLRVKAVLAEASQNRAEVYLSIINYGEVVYITECERGLPTAHEVIATLDRLSITLVQADRQLTLAAAHIKAHHPISYADAFALALTQLKGATLLTGDPEFRKVEHLANIEWLPEAL